MKTVCVYCGSRPGDNPVFSETARAFGAALADNQIKLVYGAGDFGLMGAVATSCLQAGGQTLGVIPKHIVHDYKPNLKIGDIIITETMHERKKVMFMNADAVVAMPGGVGTIDEIIEVISWKQLGLHNKPIIIMNVGGYWDVLLAMLDNCIVRDFADPNITSFYSITQGVEDTIKAIMR